MSHDSQSPSTIPSDAFPAGLANVENRTKQLRKLIAAPEIVVAPGAFDCITARLIDTAGFPAVYITGSGVSMSALGAPDVGNLPDHLRRDPGFSASVFAGTDIKVLDASKHCASTLLTGHKLV